MKHMVNKRNSFHLLRIIGVLIIITSVIFGLQENRQKESAVQKIEKIIIESKNKDAIEKIKKLKSDTGVSFSLSEEEVISLGNMMLEAGKTAEAVKILNLALDMFPESMQVHLNLSIAYKNNDNRELEIAHFQKFTQLRYERRADQIIKNLDRPPASSAEEVIERCLTAMGGKERFQSVDTMIVKLRIVNIGREPITLIRYYKRPGLYRQENIPGRDSITVINEEGVWQVRDNEWVEIGGEWRENVLHDSTIDHDFIGYEKKGITYEFMGIEGIRDAAFYKIKKTLKSGSTYALFFNIETNLLEMEYYPNPNGLHITNFYDYLEENGILIYRVAAVSSATMLFPPYVVLTEDVEINVPIDDSLFVKSK